MGNHPKTSDVYMKSLNTTIETILLRCQSLMVQLIIHRANKRSDRKQSCSAYKALHSFACPLSSRMEELRKRRLDAVLLHTGTCCPAQVLQLFVRETILTHF